MSLSFRQWKQLSQKDFPRNTSTHSQICKQRRENKLCLQRGSQKLLRIVSHPAKPACHNSHLPDSLSQPSKAGEQSNNEQHSTPGGLLMLKSHFFLQDHKRTFSFSGRTSGMLKSYRQRDIQWSDMVRSHHPHCRTYWRGPWASFAIEMQHFQKRHWPSWCSHPPQIKHCPQPSQPHTKPQNRSHCIVSVWK